MEGANLVAYGFSVPRTGFEVKSLHKWNDIDCAWLEISALQTISRPLLSGDQGYYSCSSEAHQDHQKLESLTPFPSFTVSSTNSVPQIIIYPKNVQYMERLAFSFLPESYNLPSFKSKINKLDLISLSS